MFVLSIEYVAIRKPEEVRSFHSPLRDKHHHASQHCDLWQRPKIASYSHRRDCQTWAGSSVRRVSDFFNQLWWRFHSCHFCPVCECHQRGSLASRKWAWARTQSRDSCLHWRQRPSLYGNGHGRCEGWIQGLLIRNTVLVWIKTDSHRYCGLLRSIAWLHRQTCSSYLIARLWSQRLLSQHLSRIFEHHIPYE